MYHVYSPYQRCNIIGIQHILNSEQSLEPSIGVNQFLSSGFPCQVVGGYMLTV